MFGASTNPGLSFAGFSTLPRLKPTGSATSFSHFVFRVGGSRSDSQAATSCFAGVEQRLHHQVTPLANPRTKVRRRHHQYEQTVARTVAQTQIL
jgi:hypothetical protein